MDGIFSLLHTVQPVDFKFLFPRLKVKKNFNHLSDSICVWDKEYENKSLLSISICV